MHVPLLHRVGPYQGLRVTAGLCGVVDMGLEQESWDKIQEEVELEIWFRSQSGRDSIEGRAHVLHVTNLGSMAALYTVPLAHQE